jgi:hypothetical protein
MTRPAAMTDPHVKRAAAELSRAYDRLVRDELLFIEVWTDARAAGVPVREIEQRTYGAITRNAAGHPSYRWSALARVELRD